VREPFMSEIDTYERLNRVFRETLADPDIRLGPETRAADVAGWDSLNHVRLIVAIETEYGTQFSLDELEQFATVGDLVKLLAEKGCLSA
jgi:acyl carrier protein